METTRSLVGKGFAVASLALLGACEATLDPRRFDSLSYGMGHAAVEQALAAEVDRRLYVLPDAPGAPGWVVDAYRSDHPHPGYLVAYRDGELASVLTQYDLPKGVSYLGTTMGPDRIKATIERFASKRHPLQWAELEPIDRQHLSSEASPTTVMLFWIAACPPVAVSLLVLPAVWLTMPMVEGDVHALRVALSSKACALPPRATCDEVLKALGEPQQRHKLDGQPECELWDYSVADQMVKDFSCRLGFVAGQLRWVQARRPGPWHKP